ncbi:unnamed protein product [Rotaria sordida]|uniref:IRG-type G domain-containing protein n=1 Tax=Rotaria sordida TaxID=392033 RepID=A0A815S350_9BILA|nr:unnamed protein product [Rotaria sordida]CAF1419096.1 unnamed protein product [Rotaria sordida]CAF1484254.1 unnamed protein product [Rotaria sordida]CAF3903518.1 unnamed protein product [Rotaria sordida]CAF3929203.1 unnamed protein product [Rotaria sordida]
MAAAGGNNADGGFSEEEKEEVARRLGQGGAAALHAFLREKLEKWSTIPLKVAITGQSGADQPEAAPVGIVQTTIEVKSYPDPKNKMLVYYDLPGVGTPEYSRHTYCEKVNFGRYDLFIILSSERFTEDDLWLATTITAATKKSFFFARTKIDQDLVNEKRDHPSTYNEERKIEQVRSDCSNNLRDFVQGTQSRRIFVISGLMDNKSKYDYNAMCVTLIEDFPALKQEAMIFSMSANCEGMLP